MLLRSSRTAAELAEIAPPVYVELATTGCCRATAPTSGLTGQYTAIRASGAVELPTTEPAETLAVPGRIAASGPLWLGPGLHPDRARELATRLPLAGLVFPSGDEVKPGLRDFDQLEAVFEALEID